MKIVIDIDEEKYTRIKTALIINAGNTFYDEILTSVAEGEPLPQGQGEWIIRGHGEWIIHNDYHENCRYGCNQCGNLTNIPGNFCPNCGVKMRVNKIAKGGEKDESRGGLYAL